METMKELKQYLKDGAVQIRELKMNYKNAQREFTSDKFFTSMYRKQYGEVLFLCGKLSKMRRDYRHYHIAYSELKGRARNQIEASYPYEGQSQYEKPNEELIKSIKSNIKRL